jgi:hypothetical protein
MSARTTPREFAASHVNQLRRGANYRATTRTGTTVGEYLGIETPHGDRAILLRDPSGTVSISLCDLTAIRPVAA